jgi:hypothetical protein
MSCQAACVACAQKHRSSELLRGLGILWYILILKSNKKIKLLLSISNIMTA